jgi:replication factor C subunit 3/5
MQNKENIPWVEKYRPVQFENIVLDPINQTFFKNILNNGYFPNLLFYGPPGTGKTTTIINLIDEYNKKFTKNSKGSVIHLNASDERGIDVIRNQILQFVRTNNFFENCIKFVILDEVDYMTKTAQQALKYLLQSSNYNVRYCLICNYISKIDESLKNEFLCIRFNQLPKMQIREFVTNICKSENLNIENNEINKLLEVYNSDIRSMINFVQLNQQQLSNKECILSNETWETLHSYIKMDKDTTEILTFLNNISITYNCDRKTIIKKYINFIIREQPNLINEQFYAICQNILHSENANIEAILNYMIVQFKYYFKKIEIEYKEK